MFDKQSLIQLLKELSFPEKEYRVAAGGAMVLHGFLYSEDIEFYENWLESTVEIINSIPVVCADELLHMKQKPVREKDLSDIALIKNTQTAINVPPGETLIVLSPNGSYRIEQIHYTK